MKRSTTRRGTEIAPHRAPNRVDWPHGAPALGLAGPWLARGTRIATVRGELPVEVLGLGDVLIAGGLFRATVHRVERRLVHCIDFSRPWDAWPVHVRAGALGANLPHRDLLLSPGHRVYVDGVLIPIRCLIDGHAIAQPRATTADYWRILLDSPDIIGAEGLPVEAVAVEAVAVEGAAVESTPDSPQDRDPAPGVESGLLVEAVRARVTRRRAA